LKKNTKVAPDFKPTFKASELEKYCNYPTMSELHKLLVKDARFARLSQQILADLKEPFKKYNQEMKQQYTVKFNVSNAKKKIDTQNNKDKLVHKMESSPSDMKPKATSPQNDLKQSVTSNKGTNKILPTENKAVSQKSEQNNQAKLIIKMGCIFLVRNQAETNYVK
jgi:hypothetical protein